MQTKEAIFKEITKILVELFEIEADDISMESKLYEDLDLDSIDAVDLVVKLQELTGKKINPDEFKAVRSVQDIVESVYKLVAA